MIPPLAEVGYPDSSQNPHVRAGASEPLAGSDVPGRAVYKDRPLSGTARGTASRRRAGAWKVVVERDRRAARSR
jgi:hypothetical protein